MLRGWNEEVLSRRYRRRSGRYRLPIKPVERMIAAAYNVGGQLPGDKWLIGGRRLDLAREAVDVAVSRPDARAARTGRRGGNPRFRPQPEGPAAGRSCRLARHDGAGSGHPHRRQGRRCRRHRQAFGDNDRLSVPAEERCARHAGRAGIAGPQAQGRADRDRQWHRQPRDREACRRHACRICRRQSPPRSSCPKPVLRSIPPRRPPQLEFPGLDVSLRGAVSIARRLQDPLAELVKIEPKSIGVGQYQHDVDQSEAQRARWMRSWKTR